MGWGCILDSDVSSVGIDALIASAPRTQAALVDVTLPLPFRAGSFSCVIDKGTLDAVTAGAGKEARLISIVSELVRVVVPGGPILVASIFPPDERWGLMSGFPGAVVRHRQLSHTPLELPQQESMWLYEIRGLVS